MNEKSRNRKRVNGPDEKKTQSESRIVSMSDMLLEQGKSRIRAFTEKCTYIVTQKVFFISPKSLTANMATGNACGIGRNPG